MKKLTIRIPSLLLFVLAISVSSCKKDDGEEPATETCGNGLDDDGDGFVDYEDADCVETGDECNNGLDDDGDSFTDMDDLDCTETGSECGNGIDDDGDGFTDCDDLDCTGTPPC